MATRRSVAQEKNKDEFAKGSEDGGSKDKEKTTALDLSVAGETKRLKVFKRRWYILAVFCIFSFSQACVWNTFGPISSTSERVFGWDNGDIALLANWGPITYIASGVFFSWMLEVRGLREASLLSALLVAVGTGLRCITMESPAVTWLMHVGQFLNGLGGPVAMGAPPIVSAVWFPLHERATATAIGTTWNYMGVAISFLLGPFVVPSLPAPPVLDNPISLRNVTEAIIDGDNVGTTIGIPFNESLKQYEDQKAEARDAILLYMFIAMGWCVGVLVLMLIYYPKKPPLPPCPSAAIQRENFLKGLQHLMTNKPFLLVALIYGVSFGVVNSWSSMLTVVLSDHGVSEQEAGWIGFYGTVGACLMALIIARFADIFSKILKWFVLGLFTVSAVAFLIFALVASNVIPSSTVIFYVTIITAMTSITASVPLIFELGCELAYPTGEGTTNVVLTICSNIVGLIFLFIEMIPNIGTLWMSWTAVGALFVSLPLLLLLKENYKRTTIDENKHIMDVINAVINVEQPANSQERQLDP